MYFLCEKSLKMYVSEVPVPNCGLTSAKIAFDTGERGAFSHLSTSYRRGGLPEVAAWEAAAARQLDGRRRLARARDAQAKLAQDAAQAGAGSTAK